MTNQALQPKQMLDDLAREIDGEALEETFTFGGFVFRIRLLTEDEQNWRNSYINTGNQLSTISSWRLPTLAIGIREINNIPIFEFFREEWEREDETRDVVKLIAQKGKFSQKYFAAECLMEFLAERFPEKLQELYNPWQELEKRREEAQDATKKSSGEDSEKDTSTNGTESSPSGDE